MNISDKIDSNAVWAEALALPVFKAGGRNNRVPDSAECAKAFINVIKKQFIERIASEVEPLLHDAMETQSLLLGERNECDDQSAWDEAIDEAVEKLLKPYNEYLSHDWLAKNTIDTALHEEDAVPALASRVGTEVYKQFTADRTPNQILTSAGIPHKVFEATLNEHILTQSKEGTNDMTDSNTEITVLVDKVREHLGKGYDIMAVYSDFDLISDDDEILAAGAAPRLGLAPEDVRVFQMFRFEHGDETADVLIEMLKEAPKKAATPKKKAAKQEESEAGAETPVEKPKAPAKAKAKAAKADKDGAVDPVVLTVLRDCGMPEAPLAKILGVSRSTAGNYVSGKTPFIPTADQASLLRSEMVTRVNRLLEALANFDGSNEPQASVY